MRSANPDSTFWAMAGIVVAIIIAIIIVLFLFFQLVDQPENLTNTPEPIPEIIPEITECELECNEDARSCALWKTPARDLCVAWVDYNACEKTYDNNLTWLTRCVIQ